MTQKQRSVPAYAVVAQSIRDQILAGELLPGTRLPSEAELIESYGHSRSTIREAIRSLASANLVHTTRGVTGGTFVSAPDVGHISAHVETGVALLTAAQSVSVDQLMDVRQLTEVPAAGRAAFSRSPQQLEQLREAIFDPSDAETFEKNQEFHLVILRAADNPLLELVTAPVYRVLASRFGRDRAPAGFFECVDDDHRAILATIENGDSLAAMTAMRRHLDHLGDAYEAMDLLARDAPQGDGSG